VSFLIDTNVVSESIRARPEPNVVAWLSAVDEDEIFMSVISLAELRRGIELLPVGRRREQLADWVDDDLVARFHGRLLVVDRLVADAWAGIMSRTERAGKRLGVMDAFLAATAESHDLTLVTRNTRDFNALGLPLFNPWRVG
jgi:hypothetical protein